MLAPDAQTTARTAHQHATAVPASSGGKATAAKAKTTAAAKASPAGAAATAKRQTVMPASWKAPDLTITMGTRPGLKFSQDVVEVKAGSRVKLVFNNEDDMLHNFVVVLPGTAIDVGTEAMKLGLDGQQQNYIPETDKVLYHTVLLQPETSETIYFTAPEKPGEYTYVCTVPGHFYVMQGTLKVMAR